MKTELFYYIVTYKDGTKKRFTDLVSFMLLTKNKNVVEIRDCNDDVMWCPSMKMPTN